MFEQVSGGVFIQRASCDVLYTYRGTACLAESTPGGAREEQKTSQEKCCISIGLVGLDEKIL